MARKITQIAVCGVERTEFTQCSIVTVALCDDGTVWHLYNEHEGWYQQPNVPQEIVEEKILQPTTAAGTPLHFVEGIGLVEG